MIACGSATASSCSRAASGCSRGSWSCSIAVQARLLGETRRRRGKHAAFARGHDLRRVEAERADRAEAAGRDTGKRRAVRVGGVLDQPQPAAAAQLRELRRGGADDPADVHRDGADRVRGEPALGVVDRDAERVRVGVDQHGPAARVDQRGCGREEGVGRHQHVLPRDAERAKGDLERGGAARDRHRVGPAAQRREGALELGAVRAEGELARSERRPRAPPRSRRDPPR